MAIVSAFLTFALCPLPFALYRPHVPLTATVITFNEAANIDACLASLARPGGMPAGSEIIVVDNASEDDSVAHLRAHFPDVCLIENRGAVLTKAQLQSEVWGKNTTVNHFNINMLTFSKRQLVTFHIS